MSTRRAITSVCVGSSRPWTSSPGRGIRHASRVFGFIVASLVAPVTAQTVSFDDRPATSDEWGFRPAAGSVSQLDPPALVWRPQPGATAYQVQVSRNGDFHECAIDSPFGAWPVLCPPQPIGSGEWAWRIRFRGADGTLSDWSRSRRFTIAADAHAFAIPPREIALARIPDRHPRLFVRPDDRERLRTAAHGELAEKFAALKRQCEAILENPPSVVEPPRYPAGVERKSEEWREIWWGNRRRTIAVLEAAANLAFAHWIGGDPRFADEAKRLLLAAAEWDPKGATSFRYNDEAGMPYAYHFARTWTFLHDVLDAQENARCVKVLRVRGAEMFAILCPKHFWTPFNSHANRAWHFLGELGIALHGEVPEADDWTWFALNVFGAVYPVWSDSDGGWHEGLAYWRSYLSRFTWWADVMRAALDVDAFEKPFFSSAGYFAMYLQPPGTRGGGFGDLCGNLESDGNASLVGLFARAAGNPHWQWYRDAHPEVADERGWIGFLRAAREPIESQAPDDLPTSRLFAGTGVAALNSSLVAAQDNVTLLFKSSPFGSQSHGYDGQNSFIVQAFGERLLIRSGRRDLYGSDHHRDWMWSTRSVNSITVDGRGQRPHSSAARGRVTAFATTPRLDLVEGEAAAAYENRLDRFTRTVVYARPGVIVVFDRLRARKAATFQFWLHAESPFEIGASRTAHLLQGAAACDVRWLAPTDLEITQTDRFDPPPRPRVKLVQHHLTATTIDARQSVEFVTVLNVQQANAPSPGSASLRETAAGYEVRALVGDDVLVVTLPREGDVIARLEDTAGFAIGAIDAGDHLR